MRIVSAAAAALLFVSSSFPAVAADISLLTVEEIEAIVGEAGGTEVERAEAGGATFVRAKFQDQPYAFALLLCDKDDKTKCAGVLMSTAFKLSEHHNADLFNDFNKAVPFITAVKLNSELMAFGRFAVSLGGVTRENLKANLSFLSVAPQIFVEWEKRRVIASTGTGAATTLAQTAAPSTKLEPVELTGEQVTGLMEQALLTDVKPK